MVYIPTVTPPQKRTFGLQDISDCKTSDEVIEKLQIGKYTEEAFADYPGKKGIRDDFGNGLAIVGHKYRLAQPSEVIKRVDPIRENLGATFDKFGFLDEGRRFFLRCKMPNPIDIVTSRGKDEQQTRFSTMAGVDGSTKEIHSLDVWREVCKNGMMGWAKDILAGVRHTVNFEERIVQALTEAPAIAGAFTDLQTQMQTWANQDVSESQAHKIINRIFAPEAGKDVPTAMQNTRDRVMVEFSNERRGAYGETLYDLANALTAWNTHERSRKGEKDAPKVNVDGQSFSENRLLGLRDSETLLESMNKNAQLVLA